MPKEPFMDKRRARITTGSHNVDTGFQARVVARQHRVFPCHSEQREESL